MTNREHHRDADARDPIRQVFDDYERPPADIVPAATPSLDDELAGVVALDAIAGKTVTVTHHEITGDGVTEHRERLTITRPITPNRKDI